MLEHKLDSMGVAILAWALITIVIVGGAYIVTYFWSTW